MEGATILVVEDEAAIAEVLEYNLEKEGFDVAVEYRGDTALNAIRSNPPDLVVLDLMLPGLDGLELTRVLKRDPKTAAIPPGPIDRRQRDARRAGVSAVRRWR
jgi:DNA-binding response OmpR family regulator